MLLELHGAQKFSGKTGCENLRSTFQRLASIMQFHLYMKVQIEHEASWCTSSPSPLLILVRCMVF